MNLAQFFLGLVFAWLFFEASVEKWRDREYAAQAFFVLLFAGALCFMLDGLVKALL